MYRGSSFCRSFDCRSMRSLRLREWAENVRQGDLNSIAWPCNCHMSWTYVRWKKRIFFHKRICHFDGQNETRCQWTDPCCIDIVVPCIISEVKTPPPKKSESNNDETWQRGIKVVNVQSILGRKNSGWQTSADRFRWTSARVKLTGYYAIYSRIGVKC